ncbi:hypothetical protein C8R46DRAFT_1000300 [Mycena filopes]|nr:hypothetical protein C8R46DRAFT_1000300 [Mycena filopes]
MTSSPFAAHLGTNYCPSDQEVLEINSLLAEPTLRLKSLDDEITDLQKAIDKLAAERETIATFVDAHKALISPARRLPLDITEAIFVACLPTHRNCVMSASEAPVLLGRICSAWRTISLGTPRLWASLHITNPSIQQDSTLPASLVAETTALRLAVAQTWLRRSGQCGLSISYVLPPPPGPGAPPGTQFQVLQLMAQFTRRWQHIRFFVPDSTTTLPEIHNLAEADVPLLETFQLDLSPPFIPTLFEWESLGILRGPSLSSFTSSADLALSLEPPPVMWERLTTLSLAPSRWGWGGFPEGLTTGVILKTVSRCPALRSCTLTVNDIPIDPHSQDLPVDLPFLHTLEIYHVGNGPGNPTISAFLQRLSVPALRKFLFRGRGGDQSNDSLAPFIGPATQLEDVELDGDIFSKANLIETLRSLPFTVKRLVISAAVTSPDARILLTPLDDDILALLTPTVNSKAICCPALKTLLVRDGGLISDAALLQFIMARIDVATLERVAVEFHRTRTLELDRLLAPLIQTGLAVSIIHYPIRMFSRDFSPWNGVDDDDDTMSWEPAVIGLPYRSPHLANW